MGLNVKVGSFNIGLGAAASTVPVTTGFQPKAILFWWNGRTEGVDTTGGGHIRQGTGFAVSSTSFRAVSTYDGDGLATQAAMQALRTDACIMEVEDVGGATQTFIGWADLQSMDATGFTLEILDAFATNLRIHYIAWGGTDIDAEIVSFVPAGTAPTTQTVATTNVPKAIFFAGGRITAAGNSTTGNSRTQFSFATANGAFQWSGGAMDASGTGVNLSYAKTGECAGVMGTGLTGAAGGMSNLATLSSFNTGPNGFTLNWSARGLAPQVFCLVLSGTFQTHVGDFVTLTTTGTITETGIAFQPTAAIFCSDGKVAPAASGTTSSHERLMLGATDGTTQVGHNYVGRFGNTTMFNSTGVSFDTVYQSIVETNDLASGGVQAEAAWTGWTSDGFTLSQVDADVVAAVVGYIAFAPAPTATNYVLTAQSGTTSINGVNAVVTYSKTLTAQAGAVGISGVNAGVNLGRNLTAQAGAVPFTGVNADLRQTHLLTAQSGPVNIAGVSASLDLIGSVKFDVDPEALQRNAAGLPAYNNFSICGWFYIDVDTGTWAAPFDLDSNTTGENIIALLAGTQFSVQPITGGIWTNSGVIRTLSVGTWYFMAMTGDGTTVRGYVLAEGETVFTSGAAAGTYPAGTPSYFRIARNPWGEQFFGRAAAVKIWSAVLTESELLAERVSYSPQRSANLYASYPLRGASDIVDHSGNGNDLTAVGTLSGASGPAITSVQAFSLTAQAGSVPLAGVDATLKASRYVSAQLGAVGITGVSAGLVYAHILTSQAGAVPFTGTAANLLFSRLIGAQPGVLSITGLPSDLRASLLLTAQPGAVNLVGFSATLSKSGFNIDALPGALPIVGVSADLRRTNIFIAQAGDTPIIGLPAGLAAGFLLIAEEGGNIAIEGLEADFATVILPHYELTALEGSMIIIEQDADFRLTYHLTSQPGAVGIAGTNMVMMKTNRLVAQSGAVPIIGSVIEMIGVEPGRFSTDLIFVPLDSLHHHIGP